MASDLGVWDGTDIVAAAGTGNQVLVAFASFYFGQPKTQQILALYKKLQRHFEISLAEPA